MKQPPTTEMILQALEDDMLANHRPFANLHDSHTFPEPDCFFYTSRINFGAFGGILAQRFTSKNVDERIADLNKKISASGKDVGWILSPVASPGNLEERLAAAGGRKVVELTGMVLDMDELPEPPQILDLSIKSVDSERALVDYARIYPMLFHVPTEAWIEDAIAAEIEIFRTEMAPWNRWIAYLNGEPVAAGRTGSVSGFASLQILCTLPDHRNKGIGQALATHGLRHENKDHAIVWAGPDADRLYARMGYRKVCNTTVYDFQDSAESGPSQH